MTDEAKRRLSMAGIQTDEALEWLMGSEALLERLLKKFLEDPSFQELSDALEEGRQTEAFRAAHTLKGVCGNLSMSTLGELVSRQVELLRDGKDWSGARALQPEIAEAYQQLREVICQTLL